MNAIRGRWDQVVADLDQSRIKIVLRQLALVLLVLLFLGAATLLVGFEVLGSSDSLFTLSVGQVVPEDIRAPTSISYESEVLTDQRQEVAVNSVRDIYDPPDPSIARRQVQLARQILDFVADVRADEYASVEELRSDILAIITLTLGDEEIDALLGVSPERWQEVDQQVITVLERVMSTEIRDDTLRNTRQNIPNLVSVRFREDESDLITSIVGDLIETNTFFNEERTQEAKAAAADAVSPEIRSIRQGELVIPGGSIVTHAEMEALTKLGLLQPTDQRVEILLSSLLLNLLLLLMFGLYVNRFFPYIFIDEPLMILLGGIFLIILAGARVAVPDRVVQPFLYSTAALGLLYSTLAGPQIAIMGMIAIAILVGVMSDGLFVLVTMILVGGVIGIVTLRNTERLNSYFVSGVLIGLANAGVVMVFYLTGFPADAVGAVTLIGAGILNGILAGVLTLAGLYLISNLFNLPTSLRLIELTQPGQKLLQRLLREAPGTYQHSLQVANLAELAAIRIGANATLARVGALYHDVGKMHAPHFFIENQADGINPHDNLNDPYKSALIIIDHVIEGEKMARRYRLPPRLRDFIVEHHGLTAPMYFYNKAVEQAGGDKDAVDITLFTYPGPRPQSRETAIMMLADSCESAVRARRPRQKQDVEDTVEYIFELRMRDHQLDDSGLTLRDLSEIKQVFVETLQGVFHPRIAYAKEVLQLTALDVETNRAATGSIDVDVFSDDLPSADVVAAVIEPEPVIEAVSTPQHASGENGESEQEPPNE
ncbi:HD family phosphohydrolase [Chloroflexota bacterium]